MILNIQIMYFQELFTELKKLAVLSFSVVAKLARTPIHFWTFDFFNRKIGQTLFIWLQITFGTLFLAKLLHFMSFPNVIWEMGYFFILGPFWGPEVEKI